MVNHLTLTLLLAPLTPYPPPYNNAWHHIGGPITEKIDHLGLNPNHRRYVKNIRKTVISCIDPRVKYMGRNVTKIMRDLTL